MFANDDDREAAYAGVAPWDATTPLCETPDCGRAVELPDSRVFCHVCLQREKVRAAWRASRRRPLVEGYHRRTVRRA